MKKLLLFGAAVLLVILPGCSGIIGDDGDAFIAYSWVSITQVYTDDPSFGETVYNGVYEDANEGDWYFEYTSLGYFWYGTYSVYRNPGVIGYDGEDVYFELCLYSFGPSFYEWSEEYARDINLALERGDEYFESIDRGGYTVELHAQRLME